MGKGKGKGKGKGQVTWGDQRLDDTWYTSNEFNWTGNKWTVASNGSQAQLITSGTLNNYSPVKAQITFTLTTGTVDIDIIGAVAGTWASVSDLSSGVNEFPMTNPGHWIYYIRFNGMDDGAVLTITNIEFQT